MRVLVVDDHALFRDGIVSLLEASGFVVVGQAENGIKAIEAVQAIHPDLVLMDVSMPGMTGLEALSQIKQIAPEIQVVMLTISEDDSDLLKAVQMGARGYLLKSLNSKGFLASLESIRRGEVAISAHSMTQLFKTLSSNMPEPADARGNLTERELELLKLVAEGLQNREIANKLFISENTVKYHLKSILQKLGVKNRAEAVASALSGKMFLSQ
jgi:DNA-binding NarL/FixJ family response regulator